MTLSSMSSERYKNQPLRSEYIDISATGLYQNEVRRRYSFELHFDKGLWPKYQYIHFVRVDFYTFRNPSRIRSLPPMISLLQIMFLAAALNNSVITINPRPAGGWGRLNAPLRFFEDSENTAAPSAAGFSPTLHPIFSATFVKISTQGHVRSGQVTQLQNNFPIAPRLQCFRESYETFGIWWGHQFHQTSRSS